MGFDLASAQVLALLAFVLGIATFVEVYSANSPYTAAISILLAFYALCMIILAGHNEEVGLLLGWTIGFLLALTFTAIVSKAEEQIKKFMS